jgi:hypothetical protein
VAETSGYFCSICGISTSLVNCVEDVNGRIYCRPCYDAATASPPDEPAAGYACRVCGRVFDADGVYSDNGAYICQSCYDTAQLTAAASDAHAHPLPYAARLQNKSAQNDATVALVLGILSLFTGCVGILLGIIAIVYAQRALESMRRTRDDTHRSLATAGLVLGIVAVGLGALGTVAFIGCLAL